MRHSIPVIPRSLARSRAIFTNSWRLLLIAAFFAGVLALRMVGFHVPAAAVYLFAAWAVAAAIVRAVSRRIGAPAWLDRIQVLSYFTDLTFLTAVLAALGGGWWVGAAFHAFGVTFAFAAMPRRHAVGVTVYSAATFLALLSGLTLGWIPEHQVLGLPAIHGNVRFAMGAGLLGVLVIVAAAATQAMFVGIMRRAQSRYRLLLETAPDLIVSTDAGGVIESANEAAAELLGVARSELPGTPLSAWVHPEDREGLTQACQAAQAGQPRQLEARLRAPDGTSERWCVCSCNPIEEERTIVGVLLVARDITDRKQQEEALRRSEQQLRQAQRMEAVGRLAGGVAHDFNNLLAVITSHSELLLHAVDRGTPRRKDVESIHAAAMHAATLTSQLLTFGRQQSAMPRVLDLNGIIRGMETTLRQLASGDARIRFRLYDRLDPIEADQAQLEQILMNLVVNARDAMPAGGEITVETDNVLLDERYALEHPGVQPGKHVLLQVSDTGEGIEPELQALIFEPFFTTKSSGKGTGLGLATVYAVVRQSGGHITLQSEVGHGSTFRVFLPSQAVASGSVEAVRHPSGPAAVVGTETILLVEDGGALRDLLMETLESRGYTVLQAASGTEALALSDSYEQPIHLLISDIVMPEMGGRELGLQLAVKRPDLRMLFMSGAHEPPTLRQGVRHPGVDFLSKPFHPDMLVSRVRELLDRTDQRQSREILARTPSSTAR